MATNKNQIPIISEEGINKALEAFKSAYKKNKKQYEEENVKIEDVVNLTKGFSGKNTLLAATVIISVMIAMPLKEFMVLMNAVKSIPAKQVLKMSQEAYEAMLEDSTSPKYNKVIAKVKGKLIRVWDTMSEDARIKKHCELIAHDMGAIGFSYNILAY